VPGSGFRAAVEDGYESGIGRVDLAWIHLAAFFRVGGDENGMEEKGVLDVGEVGVESFAANRDTPGISCRRRIS